MKFDMNFIALFLLVTGCAAKPISDECETKAIFEKSKTITGKRLTPDAVYDYFKVVDQCNAFDGVIGSAFQDLSNELLSTKWGQTLRHKGLKDKKFNEILIRYISDGSSKDKFDSICKNSAYNCISKNNFCDLVNKRCMEIIEPFKR